jgi:hypothetical protein
VPPDEDNASANPGQLSVQHDNCTKVARQSRRRCAGGQGIVARTEENFQCVHKAGATRCRAVALGLKTIVALLACTLVISLLSTWERRLASAATASCFSFSPSTFLKPCSASRGTLRDVPYTCAVIAYIAPSLHCERNTTNSLRVTARSPPTAPPPNHRLRAQESPIEAARAHSICRSSRTSSNRRTPPGQGPKQKPAASPRHGRDGKTHGPAKMLPQRRSKSLFMSAHKR